MAYQKIHSCYSITSGLAYFSFILQLNLKQKFRRKKNSNFMIILSAIGLSKGYNRPLGIGPHRIRTHGRSQEYFLVAKLLYKSKCPSEYVQIPLINEHLFCKCVVHLSVGNITKGFATYGCFHPCFLNASVENKLYFS